ncbi:unnamed protein product [Rotaria socialis]|uniref:Uncharacterized protein n=1 Tax=Rotaria socialis TaxID=392032 RepID=A0A818CGH0_9BILA|nr:unnamed protein product [Rotaria socialis]CAF3721376.1 unnamed protein product [Rotaria socialis]CAF4571293.1 unnamed protein product [Rotaria socialis]CAF4653855.1 unnamed protein product [Rotaria socialis]
MNDVSENDGPIEKNAREGQMQQADKFLQNTAKKQQLDDLSIDDNVLVPVPVADRGPADARNVLCVIMNIKIENIS